jgi:hypothetical protein
VITNCPETSIIELLSAHNKPARERRRFTENPEKPRLISLDSGLSLVSRDPKGLKP